MLDNMVITTGYEGDNRIEMMNSEKEQTAYFNIRFNVRISLEENPVRVIVNLGIQADGGSRYLFMPRE